VQICAVRPVGPGVVRLSDMLSLVMSRALPWPLLLLLVLLCHSSNLCGPRDLHFLEFFAGSAAFSGACKALGLKGHCQDIDYDRKSMDILSPAGFVSWPQMTCHGCRFDHCFL
jgi:hypothetical protein